MWRTSRGIAHMGWVCRGNRSYYYQAISTPDGPRNVCLGSGANATAAAAAVRARTAQRTADARVCQEQAARHTAAEAPLDALGAAADLLVRALLLAAGYDRQHRGPWRKRRDQ